MNTLGIFENGQLYSLVKNWQALIAVAYRHTKESKPDDYKLISDLLNIHEETKDGFISPSYEEDARLIREQLFESLLSKIGACFLALVSFNKVEGLPAAEVADSLLASCTGPFESLNKLLKGNVLVEKRSLMSV